MAETGIGFWFQKRVSFFRNRGFCLRVSAGIRDNISFSFSESSRRQAGARTGDQVHPTFCLCQLDYDTMSFTSVEWGTRQPDAQKGFLLPLRSRSPRPGPRPSPSLISLAYKRTHSHFAYTACIGRASRRGDRRRAKGRLPMFLFLNLPTLLTRSYARSSEPGDAVPRWRWPFRARVHHK